MSSTEDEDLPPMSPILDPKEFVKTSDHIGISFHQLVLDKRNEETEEEVHQELLKFTLDDSDGDEEEDMTDLSGSQTLPTPKEVLSYGMRYITGYKSLPEILFPPQLQELCPPGAEADLLVLLPWGPIIKTLFETPAYYQVWLFGLVCYCQDPEASRQACSLLHEELKKNDTETDTYNPTSEDITAVFDDYGAVRELEDMELVTLYDKVPTPTYFSNIKNALKIYACGAKQSSLESALTVIKLIVRLCQDQHLTSSIDFDEYSDILSNILDGLGCFTSVEIDKISQIIADQGKSILVAPALCQVIRSGNPRCHLISEQVTLLILSKYCEIDTSTPVTQDHDRQQLHHLILKLAERSHETEELGAICTILDYHINQAVLNKDQLSEVHSALYKLYGEIKEQSDRRLSNYRTGILATISCVFKRMQSGQDTMNLI